jgi:ribose 5-phosphate isomerase A
MNSPGLSATEKKRRAAEAAVSYVTDGMLLGVGTGSTVGEFIEVLKARKKRLQGAVSSSRQTSERLRSAGIAELDLNAVGELALYIDGADEATRSGMLIKGGGAALTREKIGACPLPVEVIPMARSYVARELAKLGGEPVWREGVLTDNGNAILDVRRLTLTDPKAMEDAINGIAGVVTVGLFAHRGADVLLVAGNGGIETLTPQQDRSP